MNVNKSSNFSSEKLNNHSFIKNKNFFGQFLYSYRIFFILFVVCIIICGAMSHFFKTNSYRILYNNLTNFDGGRIITQLKKMNIPYKFTQDSGSLLVPDDQIYEVRFRLAELGLPKEGNVGFELLDKDKLGSSQFLENINYNRALEGELARSILRIQSIKDARVHISIPKESLFLHENKKASASIVVNLYPGKKLNLEQINAIIHLISSGVSGLSSKNISIIDGSGHLLTPLHRSDDVISNTQLQYTKLIEDRYSRRIENILVPLVGLGNVHATVTAKINFNIETRSEDRYNPNYDNQHKSIRSEQVINHLKVETQKLPQSLSHGSNVDAIDNNDTSESMNNNTEWNEHNESFGSVNDEDKGNQSFMSSTTGESNVQKDNTINYELDHTISHIKINTGDVKRLSVAVVVNYIKDGKGNWMPLSHQLLSQINDLIYEVIGHSQDRQDSVKLVNARFISTRMVLPKKSMNIKRLASSNNNNTDNVNIVSNVDNKFKQHLNENIDNSFISKINTYISNIISNNINKNISKNILFYSFVILIIMFMLILYYGYKIIKYKRKNKFLLSKDIIQNKLEKSDENLIKEKKIVSKVNDKNPSNISEKNISNVSNKTNNDPRLTALMIQKWISGDKS